MSSRGTLATGASLAGFCEVCSCGLFFVVSGAFRFGGNYSCSARDTTAISACFALISA